jgi:hypothetical protein
LKSKEDQIVSEMKGAEGDFEKQKKELAESTTTLKEYRSMYFDKVLYEERCSSARTRGDMQSLF